MPPANPENSSAGTERESSSRAFLTTASKIWCADRRVLSCIVGEMQRRADTKAIEGSKIHPLHAPVILTSVFAVVFSAGTHAGVSLIYHRRLAFIGLTCKI